MVRLVLLLIIVANTAIQACPLPPAAARLRAKHPKLTAVEALVGATVGKKVEDWTPLEAAAFFAFEPRIVQSSPADRLKLYHGPIIEAAAPRLTRAVRERSPISEVDLASAFATAIVKTFWSSLPEPIADAAITLVTEALRIPAAHAPTLGPMDRLRARAKSGEAALATLRAACQAGK